MEEKRKQEGSSSGAKRPRSPNNNGRSDRREHKRQIVAPEVRVPRAVYAVDPPVVNSRPLDTGRSDQLAEKFFRYHQVPGHATEEGTYLKQEIEVLIRRGRKPRSNQWR